MKQYVIKKGDFYHYKNKNGGDMLASNNYEASLMSKDEDDKTCRLLNIVSESYDYKTIKL